MECIKYDFKDIINDLLENERNEIEKSKLDEIKYYDNILNIIQKEFLSNNYDTSNVDNGEDDIIKTEKLIITFTTTENQRNNINNNMSKIDLGECEILLRNLYQQMNHYK